MVAQIVRERQQDPSHVALIAVDADEGLGVLEEELAPVVLLLVGVVQGHLDVGLEMRQILGIGRADRNLHLLGFLELLVGVGHVEVEALPPVAAVDHPLRTLGFPQHGGHESAGDHVGVLAQLAGGQLEAEDVFRTAAVRGEVEPLAVR